MSKNRDKFVELAEKRVTRALKDIRLIGNLSNKTNYFYTDDDVKKILSALRNEVTVLGKKFESTESNHDLLFKL